MKSLVTTIISLLFAATSAMAAEGWQKASWGMAKDEVQAAYPDSKLLDGGLRLKEYHLQNWNYTVEFGFDAQGKLYRVTLACPSKRGTMAAPMRQDFDQIQRELSEKYGAPATPLARTEDGISRMWVKGDTEIRMSYFVWRTPAKNYGMEIVYLSAPKWQPVPMASDAEEMKKL